MKYIFNAGPQGCVFPRRGYTLICFPPALLARLGPLAGSDKAILSICGSASLAPAFLAVIIFTVISGRYPRPDITVLYLYVRPFIAAYTALYLGIRCPRGPTGA